VISCDVRIRVQGCGCTSLEAAKDHVASIPHVYSERVKSHPWHLARRFVLEETLNNMKSIETHQHSLSHQRSCEPVYMSLSISLLSTSESKILCPSACVPSLVGRSGSVCVVKRQKSIYNAQRVATEDILMPCHPRRDQLRSYRIHREGQCSRARVPCHRMVVRGDREVYRSLLFYDNCGAYISQFL